MPPLSRQPLLHLLPPLLLVVLRAGLAVYNRSLTPAEHYVLAQQ